MEEMVFELPDRAREAVLLTCRQVSEMTGFKKTKLNELTMRKKNPIPSKKIDGARKYPLNAVLWWINNQKTH